MTPAGPLQAPTALLRALAELKRDPATLDPLDVGAFALALRLVTPADVADDELIARLAAWRARDMASYPTQFPVTAAGTATWLRHQVLDDADRLMFLIVDEARPYGAAFGHMGFDHVDPSGNAIHLSNVVKGDRARLPFGAMDAAERRMLAWVRATLGVADVHAMIFADNLPSRRLHERLGFGPTARIGLRRHVDGDRIAFRPREDGDDAEPDRCWIRFTSPGPAG